MAAFEWDDSKATGNERKHGIDFAEATTVFEDPAALVRGDEWHSVGEERFLATGLSTTRRLLTVSYTMRGDNTRIISARLATPAETHEYERHADD